MQGVKRFWHRLKAIAHTIMSPACEACGQTIGSNRDCGECDDFNVDMNTW